MRIDETSAKIELFVARCAKNYEKTIETGSQKIRFLLVCVTF